MRRLSISAVCVLQAIASGFQSGFDIIDQTGLPSGTVYPRLAGSSATGCEVGVGKRAGRARRRPPGAPLLQADRARREGARRGGGVLPVAAAGGEAAGGAGLIVLRWCDLVLRAAAPLVPSDIRRDWLREWRAEFAYARVTRAARLGQPMPLASLPRAAGAIVHAAWLRWDRWRIEMIWQDVKHALRTLKAQARLHRDRGRVDAGDRHRRDDRHLRRGERRVAAAAAVSQIPISSSASTRRSLKQPDRSAARCRRPTSPTGAATTRRSPSWPRSTAIRIALTGMGAAEQIPAGEVTGGFFAVMGTRAARSDAPSPTADDPMGGRDVVVLSHALWARRFGSNPAHRRAAAA